MDPLEIMNRAVTIDGWMADGELLWLAQTAQTKKIIIEVGSWKGRSTKALSMATPGVVYAVDHWKGSESERTQAQKEAVDLGADKIYQIFCNNVADEIKAGRCVPIRADCADAVPILEEKLKSHGSKADMIFIDGDHLYQAVIRDLLNYAPLLKPGGILCGHDYSVAIPEVMKAVDELVPSPKIGAGSIWYAIKPVF